MPRPERPIMGDGPLARFARDLRDLRRQAGSPAYRSMARTVGVSPSALAGAASAVTQPTWALTEAYVRACSGDVAHWHRRWKLLTAEHTTRRVEGQDRKPNDPDTKMHFYLLGSVRITDRNSDEVPLRSRERSVLTLLLLSVNQRISRDQLIDHLWGDHLPIHPIGQLYKSISALRLALDTSQTHAQLPFVQQGYRLEVPAEQIDLRQFELLTQQGRRCRDDGDTQTASWLFRQALALWTGEPLANVSSPALDVFRTSLYEQRRAAYQESLTVDLDLGRHSEVINDTAAVAAEYPYDERLHMLRMVALYRAGRQAEALQIYQDLYRFLADNLGITPDRELQGVQQAILTHDPVLDTSGWRQQRSPATVRIR